MFYFHFPHFYFAYNFVVLQKSAFPLASSSLVLYPERAQTESSIIRGSSLKGHKPPFWISVNLSDTFKTQMEQNKHPFVWLQGRKSWSPTNYFLYGAFWSWLIWVSVKILITLFWFLQNSSARSCFKGSLIVPMWSYIML